MTTSATPLLGFLRALTIEQRKAFAAEVGTTVVYLYQMATNEEPNPKLRMAKRIVETSARYAGKTMTRPLGYDDLLVGARDLDAT
jgi:hypothetical protein